MDEPQRLSAEEADARFAALVSAYRRERPRRVRLRLPGGTAAGAAIALAAVYACGVVLGSAWPSKAVGLIVFGVPLLLVVRTLATRGAARDPADD